MFSNYKSTKYKKQLPKIKKSKNGLGEWYIYIYIYIYIYTYIYLIEVDSGHLSRLVQPGTRHQRTRQSLRREWRSLEPEVCCYRPSNRKSDHEYGLACLSVFSFELFLVLILLIYIDDERRALVKYSSWGHV